MNALFATDSEHITAICAFITYQYVIILLTLKENTQ